MGQYETNFFSLIPYGATSLPKFIDIVYLFCVAPTKHMYVQKFKNASLFLSINHAYRQDLINKPKSVYGKTFFSLISYEARSYMVMQILHDPYMTLLTGFK